MPRVKRAKAYRKLMQKFSMSFGFREPYQVIVDASLLADSNRFKMDLIKGLQQTLSAKIVKPMITTCSMRHLYASKSEPGVVAAIEEGKTFERRRCGHMPQDYPEPLSTLECLRSIVDPKGKGVNKNHYIIASNERDVRAHMRQITGVPLIYISRSVMIMEPMADETTAERNRDEKAKLRAGIKRFSGDKRKRDDDDDDDDDNGEEDDGEKGEADGKDTTGCTDEDSEQDTMAMTKKKKKIRGPKGPNPLSVKKKKTPSATGVSQVSRKPVAAALESTATSGHKRKRKRGKNGVAECVSGDPGVVPVRDPTTLAAATNE